jgi:hypothetical protein
MAVLVVCITKKACLQIIEMLIMETVIYFFLPSQSFRPSKSWSRRLRISPEVQGFQARGRRIPRGDLLSPPGNAHGRRAAVVHCRGLAEGIIIATGAVMMDKTG